MHNTKPKLQTIPKAVFTKDGREIWFTTHRKTDPLRSTEHDEQHSHIKKESRSTDFDFNQFLIVLF